MSRSRALGPWLAAWCLAASSMAASPAGADDRIPASGDRIGVPRSASPVVVVVGGGPAFRDAVALALSPWHVDVRRGEGAAPRASMPRAAEEARDLAGRYHAVGVAWIASGEGVGGAPALFVYDAKTEQIVSRAFGSGLPLDEPSAAAAALSVKTLFRSSTVAPVEERIGAEAARETPELAATAPAPVPSSPPGLAPRPPDANASARLRLEVSGAVRSPAVGEVDPQVGLGVAYHLGRDRAVGLALEFRGGPGISVTADRFVGRYTELSSALWFRYRKRLGSFFALTPEVGTALRTSWLSGLAVGATERSSESRADVAMAVGLSAELLASDRWLMGIELAVAYRARFQRYLVESVPVLTLRAVEPTLALRLSTGLL